MRTPCARARARTPGRSSWTTSAPAGRSGSTARACGRSRACRDRGATSSRGICTWCRTRSSSPAAAHTPAPSATRSRSSPAAAASTPSASTRLSPRSSASPAGTSTSSTFHVLTPYPGTALFAQMEAEDRLLHRDWDHYDTRHAVFLPRGLTASALEAGYWRAYREFYRWGSVLRGAATKPTLAGRLRHLAYAGGWKKLEPAWDLVIRTGLIGRARPLLERVLDAAQSPAALEQARPEPEPARSLDEVLAPPPGVLQRDHEAAADQDRPAVLVRHGVGRVPAAADLDGPPGAA